MIARKHLGSRDKQRKAATRLGAVRLNAVESAEDGVSSAQLCQIAYRWPGGTQPP